ncbi:MAG: ATP-binding cassette, subfamily bacterial [Pseudonocardiales bacterium]|nr:ATP-binding cassette, subfamily bacterial [Pseudonocardiales bacterium]
MTQVRTTVRRARTAVRVLAPYGRPYRRHLIEGAVATVVLVAARLAFPWPLRGLMEIVFHQNLTARGGTVLGLVPHVGDPIIWLVGAFAVIVLVWGVSESLQRLAFTRYAVGLVRDVQAEALRRLPRAVKRGESAGDLISTVTSDASRVKTGAKSILIGMSRNGGFFLGVAVIVSLIDPLIGIVFLTGGLATVAAGAVGAWRSSMIVRRSREREGALTDDLHQFLSGTAELAKPAPQSRRADSKATRVEGLTTLAVHAILGTSTCTILVLTIQEGRSGALSSGSVFTILAYILLMHNKTVGLGRSIVRLGRVLPSAERIAKLTKKARHPSTKRVPTRTTAADGRQSPAHLAQDRNVEAGVSKYRQLGELDD